jgi:hypothetical protein
VAGLATGACLFFIGIRHGWLGPYLTQPALGLQLDKWQLGPLRLLNLTAFTFVVYWLRQHLVHLVSIQPFLILGKASLRVFCAHIFFVFVGLALLVGDVDGGAPGEIEQLHGFTALGLLVVTFVALMWVARNEARKARAERDKRKAMESKTDAALGATSSSHDAQEPEDTKTGSEPHPADTPMLPASSQ